jgi:eukaryotic-like serine/threonine-protein kinase
LFKAITSKSLLINILFGIFLVLLFIVLFFYSLGWITGHDKYEKVPEVIGKNVNEAIDKLKAKGFRVEVIDSIYDINAQRLSVLKQSPEPDAVVKNGRTIYLTINRLEAPTVEMPNLVGLSFKSAQLYLESLGLLLGDTSYKPDIARNSVLSQRFEGKEIKQGSRVPIGSKISFVIGSGLGEAEMDVPNLVGLSYYEAKLLLNSMNILVGIPILLDANITDTSKTYIVKQEPPVFFEPVPGQFVMNKIRPGQVIDLWLSTTPPVMDSTGYPKN